MDAIFSKMVRTGTITYFMDVKEAKNAKRYLSVSSTQPARDGGEKKFTKRSVIVFDEVADDLVSALKEAKTVVNGEGEFGRKLKCGKITYFVDVREAKNNTRYLSITESQPSRDDPKHFMKKSIAVFNNVTNDFVGAVEEAVGKLKT